MDGLGGSKTRSRGSVQVFRDRLVATALEDFEGTSEFRDEVVRADRQEDDGVGVAVDTMENRKTGHSNN